MGHFHDDEVDLSAVCAKVASSGRFCVRLQTVAGKTHSANPSKSSFGLNAYMSSC
jgi:hypothetical protein